MFNDRDVMLASQLHQERVRDALRRIEQTRQVNIIWATPFHRRVIARLGDALVTLGSRLQTADAHRQTIPHLNRMGNI
ncbi:MAG: hypothetical protein K8J31_16770 [Anaerolineae bacterium]|nr:hypothetical protein [Anaerolineae bacterium]